jgi:hypothetical protein
MATRPIQIFDMKSGRLEMRELVEFVRGLDKRVSKIEDWRSK